MVVLRKDLKFAILKEVLFWPTINILEGYERMSLKRLELVELEHNWF